MLYLCYLCRFKPLRDHLRGFLIAAWAGDKIAEFSFPEISFHFSLRPWFFFVSPAYAGKRACTPSLVAPVCGDHPRVCGEKISGTTLITTQQGSPPRMRGKDAVKRHSARGFGITPACAGKSTSALLFLSCSWDHPRMCGEKLAFSAVRVREMGSPPRMRGKGFPLLHFFVPAGITPAYAGKRD